MVFYTIFLLNSVTIMNGYNKTNYAISHSSSIKFRNSYEYIDYLYTISHSSSIKFRNSYEQIDYLYTISYSSSVRFRNSYGQIHQNLKTKYAISHNISIKLCNSYKWIHQNTLCYGHNISIKLYAISYNCFLFNSIKVTH